MEPKEYIAILLFTKLTFLCLKRLSSKFSTPVFNRPSINIYQKIELFICINVDGTMKIINEQIYQIK